MTNPAPTSNQDNYNNNSNNNNQNTKSKYSIYTWTPWSGAFVTRVIIRYMRAMRALYRRATRASEAAAGATRTLGEASETNAAGRLLLTWSWKFCAFYSSMVCLRLAGPIPALAPLLPACVPDLCSRPIPQTTQLSPCLASIP